MTLLRLALLAGAVNPVSTSLLGKLEKFVQELKTLPREVISAEDEAIVRGQRRPGRAASRSFPIRKRR
jgi:hypothetical protein